MVNFGYPIALRSPDKSNRTAATPFYDAPAFERSRPVVSPGGEDWRTENQCSAYGYGCLGDNGLTDTCERLATPIVQENWQN
jgi:hypothetical protein